MASTNQFADNTILQILLTLIFSVIIGSYLTKKFERKNQKELEIFKIRNKIVLTIVDLAGMIISRKDSKKEKALELLHNENVKVKLYFDDSMVKYVNDFLEKQSESSYHSLVNILKLYIK
ncbi:hypothetical protein ACM26V_04375 [Salipaludibacillus sp. HK11]|uniref:hypothetical protein n=1 Tax=Salipaludibacillus sp. HK11 TaxID=3394320 RepID=UPI0039FC7C76